MLDAAQAPVRFCCPGCGAGLRAPRADAGTAVSCHVCGEAVRVPRRPHPHECDVEDSSLVPAAAALDARRGCRLLHLGMAVAVAEAGVLAAVVGYWAAELGPAKVLAREAGDLRGLVVAAWLLGLALVAVRVWLTWQGYRRCGPAADAVRATGWVGTARLGLVVRTAGLVAALTPAAVGVPLDGPALVNAAAELGWLAWAVGLALEFGILVVWHRLLTELSGPPAARRVARYAGTAAVCGLVVVGVACLVSLVVLVALRQAGEPAPAPRAFARLNYEALPPEAWHAAGGLVAVTAVVALVLWWQYARLLTALRADLAPR